MSIKPQTDRERIQQCLTYIAQNPDIKGTAWAADVESEARALGLLPPEKPVVGQCCRPGIDKRIVYGGDMPDVF